MSDTKSPVGWCPCDKDGYHYLSRTSGERSEVEDDAKFLGSDSTLGAPELGPFTVVPLYAAPPAAAPVTVSEAMVEAVLLQRHGADEVARAEASPSKWDQTRLSLERSKIRHDLIAALAPVRADTTESV